MRAGRPVVRGAEDLLAHGEVDTTSAPIRRRADAGVLEVSAGGGGIVSAPAPSHLDRHVPVRGNAQHGPAGTSGHTGQDRKDQVEMGQVEEDGTHERVRLDACRWLCQCPCVAGAPTLLTGEGTKD